MVAATLRTIFAQSDQGSAYRQLSAVCDVMADRWPKAADILLNAENDILASGISTR